MPDKSRPRPAVLVILDGWGIGPDNKGNAISLAKTPNMDQFWRSFPHTQLSASGESVGLPVGEAGNTETGHLNIGAGSVVYQDLPRIDMAIAENTFKDTPAFTKAFEHVDKYKSNLHLMGLVGAGGVHSNLEHLLAILELCKKRGIERVYIHAFTDGRDSPPDAGMGYIQKLQQWCRKKKIGQIASVMGRFYAMDRDKRWDRVEKAYHALVVGNGNCVTDPVEEIGRQYQQQVTDEYLEPFSVCDTGGKPVLVGDNDAVIFFNFRIDRPRELTKAFVLPNFEAGDLPEGFDPYAIKYEKSHLKQHGSGRTFRRQKILKNLLFVTMTRFEENLPVEVAFPPQFVENPICRVFADNGLKQLRVAETEKEKFVTYYMNGQQDAVYSGEERVIIPSKGAKSYDQVPEMSAREVAQVLRQKLSTGMFDAAVCNFANADMVGHTGNLAATIKACEILDEVLGEVVHTVFDLGGVVFITADHGNAEELINNRTGQVDTEHSRYPVPFIIIGKQFVDQPVTMPSGVLADVAPTILHVLGIPQPATMSGRALL